MALLMGMRASEIVDRTVRELDGDGRILPITHATSFEGTTARHYATTDSVDSARVGCVLDALN